MNCIYFQLAMVAYNLNCWLMLFNREEQAHVEQLGHVSLCVTPAAAARTFDDYRDSAGVLGC